MKKLFVAALLALSSSALAQEVTIKLGTLAPQGSSWHTLLKELSEKWTDASGGKVKLKIYAGGTQGSEGDMVRKMGVGQLHAASITNVGMHDIIAEPMVFSTPGMMDETDFKVVFPQVQKKLEALAEAKGYVVLHWAEVGTIRVFCTKAYKTPEEMTDAKFFAWDGDPGAIDAFKLAGFRPVVLASTDIVPSLQTGMINCVAQAPAYVLTARLFDKANKMVDFPWTYLIGGTVVKKEAWEKVPADLRPKLIAIAREVGSKVDTEVKKLNDDAVEAMKKQGLEVVKVDPVAWQKAAEKSWPAVRGKVVPADFFDEVAKLREAARKAKK
jgi:TRAP-type C4-dicarboxylate transport system substrate-binding protein